MPKTGTTALEGALAPYASIVVREPADLKHSSCSRYQRFLSPFVKTSDDSAFEMMSIFRHPVDWLSSWFRYRCRDNLVGHPNSARGHSFDDFVLEYCKETPADYANVGSQANFLKDVQGKMGVDHLFRYEAQDRLLAFLRDRIGDFPEPKRLNVSPDFKVSLSPEPLEILKETRAEEFATWDAAQS